jgi:hypothetical protein
MSLLEPSLTFGSATDYKPIEPSTIHSLVQYARCCSRERLSITIVGLLNGFITCPEILSLAFKTAKRYGFFKAKSTKR